MPYDASNNGTGIEGDQTKRKAKAEMVGKIKVDLKEASEQVWCAQDGVKWKSEQRPTQWADQEKLRANSMGYQQTLQ